MTELVETFQEFGLGFPDPDLHHYRQGLPGILASSSRRHRKIHGLSSCRWSFDDIDDKSSHFAKPKKIIYERICENFFLILSYYLFGVITFVKSSSVIGGSEKRTLTSFAFSSKHGNVRGEDIERISKVANDIVDTSDLATI